MANPYIVGNPVKGERFYGRGELLQEVQGSPRSCFCVIGSRRFGKTSFLRQLEWLNDRADAAYLPVYWNLEGSEGESDLLLGLLRGVFGARARFQAVGIDAAEMRRRSAPLADVILDLSLAASSFNRVLLLLCDECEWLIPLGEKDPALLSRLRGMMQQDGVRTVIAGSRRLAELNRIRLLSSPFLNGFEPVTLVPHLSEADGLALIRQRSTGDGLDLSPDLIADILGKTDCHPYLVQAVCYEIWNKPSTRANLDKAYDLAFEQFSDNAFADDFRYLSSSEQDVLLRALREEPVSDSPEAERLERAGYLRWANGAWRLANWFFARWLRSKGELLGDIPSVVSNDAAEKLHRAFTAVSRLDDATAASILARKQETGEFDVFLCHNSADKPAVKEIGERLKERGLLPWLDEWELRPGLPWLPALEAQIGKIRSAAVFVGKESVGPWQQQELYALLSEFVGRRCPVIPVLLGDAPAKPELPVFLRAMMWVDFRNTEPDPVEQLIWGITGERGGAIGRK